MRRLIFLLLAISLLGFSTGCMGQKTTAQVTQAPQQPNSGKVDGRTYNNNFFGLSLTIPEGWSVMDNETQKTLKDKGKTTIAGSNQNLKAVMEASDPKSVNMLNVSKFPLFAQGKANVIFIASAEKIDLPNIKTGNDYLKAAKQTIEQGQAKATFGDIQAQQIGGIQFSVMDISHKNDNIVIKYKLYAALMKGYALNFYYIYSSDQELQELNTILSSVKFVK